jgi:lytic murein transglycosylase
LIGPRNGRRDCRPQAWLGVGVLFWLVGTACMPAVAADAAFQGWLDALWPQARAVGVSRATFDAATRGLEPDLTLPDLVIPGQPELPGKGQAEFVQTPADYLKESSFDRLAAQGRKLAAGHRATLTAIEEKYGVPGAVVLAIWARETNFGAQKLPYSAVRVLATQAYVGRRKEKFREEFLLALKMLEEGQVALADFRSSWAGAMGQPQFLPTDFYKYAVDFDGDGRRDIWTSVPDILASMANQLAGKGWQRGQRWAYEVRAPKTIDCTEANPDVTLPIAAWVKRGFVPAYDRTLSAAELAEKASLLLPAGTYGPAFLITPNYFVIKEYNFSDLYVLFVGHLSDRITDPRPFETPWGKVTQLATAQLEAMQRHLTKLGIYGDKIDGKAGMKTRLALGAYQKKNGLKVDCWPTQALLAHMQGKLGAE